MCYFFILLAFLISLSIQFAVSYTFKKYSQIENCRGLTGADAARSILLFHDIHDVRVEHISGELTDHYDPRDNVIRLSDDVYQGTSIVAISVACHEAGHAVQYTEQYIPIKIRAVIIPITNIGSYLGIILAAIGFIMAIYYLEVIGILLFSTVFIFQIVTIPVELNATSIALKCIKSDAMLNSKEYRGAKKVLLAAIMTYVTLIAIIVSFINLFKLILSFLKRRWHCFKYYD